MGPAQRRLFLCLLCFLCLLYFPSSAAAPEGATPFRFAVIGDSGTGDEHQYRVAAQMAAWHDRLPYELVLMLGDNVYGAFWGGGNQKDFEEKFDRPYAELLRRGVTFRAALGNHDTRHRDGQDLIDAYDRFHIGGPLGYYGFTAGEWLPEAGASGLGEEREGAPLVEFFVINTMRLEKDKQDPEQLAWLEQALAASRARWRIVYGHHALYSTGKRHGDDLKLRAKLEPLFVSPPSPAAPAAGSASGRPPEAGASGLGTREADSPRVHVVLAGHDHLYQRFYPQRAILYFVCGASGQLRRGNAEASALVAAVNDQTRSFMLWEATPTELRFRAINERGQAFDCGIVHEGQVEPISCDALAGGRQECLPHQEPAFCGFGE